MALTLCCIPWALSVQYFMMLQAYLRRAAWDESDAGRP